jgi:hypothetical protein
MQHPVLYLYILGGVFVISFFSIRKFTTRATLKPSLAEFIIAGVETIFMPAIVALLSMVVYGIIFGLSKLVELLIHLFRGTTIVPAAPISFYPTVGLAGIALLILSISISPAKDICGKLYPNTAGYRSQYYRFFTTKRSALVGKVIGSLILLLIPLALQLFTHWNRSFLLVLFQLALLSVGGLFYSETGTAVATEKKRRTNVVERVGMLLEKAGYHIEFSPHTQDASIDPLLTNLDIFAQRENHKLLLDIKSPLDADRPADAQARKSVDWKSGSTLSESAYIFGSSRDIRLEDLDARLLLIDLEADKSLLTFSTREKIPVMTVSSEQIDVILHKRNQAEQVRAVQALLHLPPTAAPPADAPAA